MPRLSKKERAIERRENLNALANLFRTAPALPVLATFVAIKLARDNDLLSSLEAAGLFSMASMAQMKPTGTGGLAAAAGVGVLTFGQGTVPGFPAELLETERLPGASRPIVEGILDFIKNPPGAFEIFK